MEMENDQEEDISENWNSTGIKKSSDLSKYTASSVINQNEFLSSSSDA
jgi:hypothetical protein